MYLKIKSVPSRNKSMWKIQNPERARMPGDCKEYFSFRQIVLASCKY